MTSVSRRQILGSIGLAAGAGLWSNFGRDLHSAPPAADKPAQGWSYTQLDPNAIADDAYRLFADGGCMYGLFGAVVTGLASNLGEPFLSFPLHMMRYGAGGVGGWGSLCGTLNGATAVIGLVEPTNERRTQLVGELFSWCETTALLQVITVPCTKFWITRAKKKAALGALREHLKTFPGCLPNSMLEETALGCGNRELWMLAYDHLSVEPPHGDFLVRALTCDHERIRDLAAYDGLWGKSLFGWISLVVGFRKGPRNPRSCLLSRLCC